MCWVLYFAVTVLWYDIHFSAHRKQYATPSLPAETKTPRVLGNASATWIMEKLQRVAIAIANAIAVRQHNGWCRNCSCVLLAWDAQIIRFLCESVKDTVYFWSKLEKKGFHLLQACFFTKHGSFKAVWRSVPSKNSRSASEHLMISACRYGGRGISQMKQEKVSLPDTSLADLH